MKQTREFTTKIQPKGTATRRVYNTAKLKELLEAKTGLNFDACHNPNGTINFDALCSMALEVLSKDEFKELLDKAAKKMFAGNWLWKFLRVKFNLDVVIPYLTGHYTTKAIKSNLVVTRGHQIYADQVGGLTTAPVTAMAYGIGTDGPAAGDAALESEVARAAATISHVTTTTTYDSCRWVHTFTSPGTQAITEEGLLDNNTSGGNLLARQVFSAVNMILNDTIAFTHTIQS